MSVTETRLIKPIPISGCKDKWYWVASFSLAGDGSGGNWEVTADFGGFSLFGGHWLFDVSLFSCQINDAAASQAGAIYIYPRMTGTEANGLLWARAFDLYNVFSGSRLYFNMSIDLPQFKFKPDDNRSIVGAPFINVIASGNTAGDTFLVSLGGHIYNELAETSLAIDPN